MLSKDNTSKASGTNVLQLLPMCDFFGVSLDVILAVKIGTQHRLNHIRLVPFSKKFQPGQEFFLV